VIAVEPSTLALFWAGVIVVAILVYVILDGFDLGIGILFGTTKDAKLRSGMMAAISPFWDGNETWLVVVGASLFAAFPVVYAVFLPAFYIPVLLLLLGLVFRGVAFEFRHHHRTPELWDRGFFLGSAVVAFVQGAAVGAMIRGIPVVNGQYAGGSFDWLALLPVLCGIGLVLGYALLGAGWLVLKSEGALRDWAFRRIPWLAGSVLAVLCIASVAAFGDRARIEGQLFLGRTWGLVFPCIGLLAMLGIFAGVRLRRDAWPFAMTVLFFIAAFLALATMFWPYMIPYSVTIGNAAAPEASLLFLFWAGVIVLPIIAVYTATVYWLFRGKLRATENYVSGIAGEDYTMGAVTPQLHHIIVVGGGAAGLELATRLGDKLGRWQLADVTLIDKSRTHLWKPLLHEFAAGSMDQNVYELDFLAQAHWHHFRYRIGNVIGVDRSRREVQLAANIDEEGREITAPRVFHYDTLIMAVGSESNDFGTPGVREHAISLDTPVEARRFHTRLVNACIRANAQSAPLRPEQLNVAIIGAGATGTELAAELRYTTRQLIAFGLDHIHAERDIKLNLIEAADRILPPLPRNVSDAAMQLLTKLGVRVRTSARVAEVTDTGVKLATGEFIPAELVVWSAGVKGSDFLRNLDGLETNRANQLIVSPTLQTTRDPDIFAIGDCAACPWLGNEGKTVPPRAQAAHQQASHLLRQMKRRLAGKPIKFWRYRDFGSLVSLSEYSTLGNLMGGLRVQGLLARGMYLSLYKMHEVALHGVSKVALDTLARRITRRTEPHVKLH
jgi:NADH:ubiquinone reductase (H+-translocating)